MSLYKTGSLGGVGKCLNGPLPTSSRTSPQQMATLKENIIPNHPETKHHRQRWCRKYVWGNWGKRQSCTGYVLDRSLWRVLRSIQSLRSSVFIYDFPTDFLGTICSVRDRKGKFGTNFLFFVVFVKDADSISIPNPPTLSGHQYRPSTTSTSMASTTSVSMASTSSAAINTSRSTLLASCVIINIPARFPVYRSISLTPMLPTYIGRSNWSLKLKI